MTVMINTTCSLQCNVYIDTCNVLIGCKLVDLYNMGLVSCRLSSLVIVLVYKYLLYSQFLINAINRKFLQSWSSL